MCISWSPRSWVAARRCLPKRAASSGARSQPRPRRRGSRSRPPFLGCPSRRIASEIPQPRKPPFSNGRHRARGAPTRQCCGRSDPHHLSRGLGTGLLRHAPTRRKATTRKLRVLRIVRSSYSHLRLPARSFALHPEKFIVGLRVYGHVGAEHSQMLEGFPLLLLVLGFLCLLQHRLVVFFSLLPVPDEPITEAQLAVEPGSIRGCPDPTHPPPLSAHRLRREEPSPTPIGLAGRLESQP